MKNINKLEVIWTGCYPCLCHGEWIISYDGKELSVPEDMKDASMFTFGEYGEWHFDEDYMEEWDYYEDGDTKEVWIRRNLEWITSMFQEHEIEITDELLSELFDKIQKQDWRHGSCGGCI